VKRSAALRAQIWIAALVAFASAARAGLWDVPGFGLAAADEIHGGIYIATDYVYDDRGADALPPAGGDYAYPAGAPYFKNAADLVEVRVQPHASEIAFGVRFNTVVDPAVPVAAIGIADGSAPALAAPWPSGAGVSAQGVRYVLTIHAGGAVLTDLLTSAAVPLAVSVENDTGPAQRHLENTFTTSVPLAALGLAATPESGTWRLHAAAGLWNGASWTPQSLGPAAFDAAFFADGVDNWQQNGQSALLATGDLSVAAGELHFDRFPDYDAPLATGRLTRVYPSPISAVVGEGIVDWVQWIYGAMAPTLNHYRGLYLTYQVWVPPDFGALPKPLPAFIHMHGASQNHLSMLGRWEDGTITADALALSPLGAGELAACKDEAEVDVVEALKDVKAHYPVDDSRVFMSGESHGGVCTYELSVHYPDLFAAGLPFIGTAEGDPAVDGDHLGGHRNMGSNARPIFGNLLNVPWRKTNSALDPIVNLSWAENDVMLLEQLGLDHEFRAFLAQSHTVVGEWQNALFHQVLDGCASAPPGCDPQLDPGGLVRDANPARVVYRSLPYHYNEPIGLVYRGAYWVSGMEVASAPQDVSFGEVDATSLALAHKLHTAGPAFGPSPQTFAPTGDPITFQGRDRVPGPEARSAVLVASLTNLSAVAFDMGRAGFAPEADSESRVEVSTDTPVALTLNALPPSAALRIDGTPVGSPDPDGSATLDVPSGAHTITVLPEPSAPLGLAAGAALLVAFLTRRSRG
jgi:predicted esterase